jgi:uncharacterized protein (TIGR03086 family)
VVVEPAVLPREAIPPVADDPDAAWLTFEQAIQRWHDDPADASRTFETRPGPMTFEQAVDFFVIGDVLIHTWDLARATGQDETLDAAEVHRAYEGMIPLDELLRASGHFGPKVAIPEDADEQIKLIAFTGRTP